MEAARLVTHAGGWEAGIEGLKSVPVPAATPSWTPVPHSRFVEEVKFNLPRFALTVKNERYALAREGAQMFGTLDLTNGTEDPDWSLAIGLRNSYDKSVSLGLVAGSRVFVCDNLAFSGEVQASRKHTSNVFRDMPSLIYGMLEGCVAHRKVLATEIAGMKGFPVGVQLADHLLVEAVRRDVVPASNLPYILKEWEKPTYEDFAPRTGWSLFNAFTLVQKARSPRSQMEDTLRLSKMFNEVLGLGNVKEAVVLS